jgi:putative ABC transport system permease protein
VFNNFLKIAIRNLVKYKIYSIINIAGMSVGIACAVLILLWVQYERSYDRFHENTDRLYRVVFTNDQKEYHGYYQPGPLAEYLKENFPEILQTTNFSGMQWKLSHEIEGFFCIGSYVDPAFFEMFTFPLIRGNPNIVLNNPYSIVVSNTLAQKMFGNNDPIGKTLKLNDQTDLTITGVYQDIPKTSHMQFDFVIPFEIAPAWMKMWDRKCTETYVLLRENYSLGEINQKIYGVMNEHNPTWKNVLYLNPMTKSHLYTPGGGGLIIYVHIFSILAILILVVACINFMNLSTARYEKRMKEIGIRKTVGSSKITLVSQFMMETAVFSFLSLLIAVILVELTLPYVNNILNKQINMHYSGITISILFTITLSTCLLSGSYPAFFLSSFKPITILKGGTLKVTSHQSSLLRKILVIAQFSFSIFIITCVLFIHHQLHFIQSRNLGFNKEQVLMIRTRGMLQQKCSIIKNELLSNPNIESTAVSANNLTSFVGSGTGPIEWEGKNTDKIVEVGFNFVDENFIKTFQIKMAQGRFFSKKYSTDMSEAVVINETAQKTMDIMDPVGKKLTTWFGRKGKVIGVIHDFHTQSLREKMVPIVLLPTEISNYLCIRMKSADISNTIKFIEKKIKEFVPDDPFEYQFLDEEINNLYKTEQVTSKLAAFFALLAIFIACLGLLGLASFSAEQRTKEIGIRKALGASVINILSMFTKGFIIWIIIANIIAWPIAWYAMNKWLQNFSYRIDLAIWPFLLAGGFALIVAILTVSWQAIRAATENPLEALRYE